MALRSRSQHDDYNKYIKRYTGKYKSITDKDIEIGEYVWNNWDKSSSGSFVDRYLQPFNDFDYDEDELFGFSDYQLTRIGNAFDIVTSLFYCKNLSNIRSYTKVVKAYDYLIKMY